MNKVSLRWVLRMLAPNCPQVSEELLKRYRRDPAKISQLAVQDETCIHNFDSESEQQSMQSYCNGTNESVKIVISYG